MSTEALVTCNEAHVGFSEALKTNFGEITFTDTNISSLSINYKTTIRNHCLTSITQKLTATQTE
jgi:hypothetical protein